MAQHSVEHSEQLINLIEERSNGLPQVPQDSVVLENGKSRLAIRLAGGFITDCQLTDSLGEVQTTLFCDPDTNPAKLSAASHFMSPAGANHELGGQHGIYRWVDYKPQPGFDKRANRVTLDAEVPNGYPEVSREFQLGTQELIIRTILRNTTGRKLHTSMGEHFYWLVPGDVKGISVRNAAGEDPLRSSRIMEAVTNNDAQYWPGPHGGYNVKITGGGDYTLSSWARLFNAKGKSSSPDAVGLLLWQRAPKGPQKSFCIEPVTGLKGWTSDIRPMSEINDRDENRQLVLAVGAQAVMTTQITLNGKA